MIFVGRTIPNALHDFGFCTLIFDYTNPDCVCCSFALAARSPPGITDLSQVDSTPLGG